MTWIAEMAVVFVDADEHRIPGRIAVGLPERISAVEAGCLIAIDGLQPQFQIKGAHPLQALTLGVQYLGTRLHDYLASGWRILDPVTNTDAGIATLFPPRG